MQQFNIASERAHSLAVLYVSKLCTHFFNYSRLRIKPVPFKVRTMPTFDHNVLSRLIRIKLLLHGAFVKVIS